MIQLAVPAKGGDLSIAMSTETIPRTAEAYLALTVLADAILCYRKYAWSTQGPKRHLFREAQRWLSCDDSNHSRFTCGFICDSLGIDRLAVTEALRAWHADEYIRRARRGTNLALVNYVFAGGADDCSQERSV